MNRRKETRIHQQQEIIRNRILVIFMVGLGALLVVFAIVLPIINNIASPATGTTNLAAAITPIATKVINAKIDGQHLGDATAPVKVDVWEDFQCPACRAYSLTIEPTIITNFVETGIVYYSYHFYPLVDGYNTAGESHHSANAALCASAQGHFWDYHNILFTNWNGENQGAFADPRLVAFAKSLGLDMTKFNQCFQANQNASFITQDAINGQNAGVQGTPSVFVNGKLLTPGFVPTYDQVAAAINNALVGK